MATLSARDRFKQNIEAGGDQVVVEYFKRLATPDVSVDDLRKAVELVAKTHGLHQTDKVDSMMTVSWTINGGNVTIGVNKPEPAPEDIPLVEDVTPNPKTPEEALLAAVSGSPDEPAKPSFEVPPVENLLDL